MPTFTSPRGFKYHDQAPNLTSTKSLTSRLLTAQFGDGYGQVAADGLNAHALVWDLRFGALAEANAALLVAEAAEAQITPVTYQVFGDVARLYRVTPGSITQVYEGGQVCAVAFQLREVFDGTLDTTATLADLLGLEVAQIPADPNTGAAMLIPHRHAPLTHGGHIYRLTTWAEDGAATPHQIWEIERQTPDATFLATTAFAYAHSATSDLNADAAWALRDTLVYT